MGEAEGACPSRRFAGVVGMIDASHNRNIVEIERAYSVQTNYVYGIPVLI